MAFTHTIFMYIPYLYVRIRTEEPRSESRCTRPSIVSHIDTHGVITSFNTSDHRVRARPRNALSPHTMALQPGVYRRGAATERDVARDVSARASVAAVDVSATRAHDAEAAAREDDSFSAARAVEAAARAAPAPRPSVVCARTGTARAWRRRPMPPRARPMRFEMDLTRREVESEGRARVGDKVLARVAGVCQEGCYPNKDNHVNQDAMLTLGRDDLGGDGELLLGVFDGHGKHGEDCSSIAREAFAETLARETGGARGEAATPGYARTFETVNGVVCKTLGDNAGFSGCTAITALFCADGKIRVGNVGDSRCVVATELDEGVVTGNRHTKRWGVRDLTRDQTCFRADERMRMKREGENAMTFATIGMVLGETEAHEDFGDGEPGSDDEYCHDPPRVFMEGCRFPGCAFTRSIGDTVAKGLGVSATPEMCEYDLNAEPRTRCVVVATDGVFEFMSSAETMAIAEKFYEEDSPNACEQAAHAIVRAAYTRWQEQDERADDVTAVVAFLYPYDADSAMSTATVVVNDVDETLNKLLL